MNDLVICEMTIAAGRDGAVVRLTARGAQAVVGEFEAGPLSAPADMLARDLARDVAALRDRTGCRIEYFTPWPVFWLGAFTDAARIRRMIEARPRRARRT